MNSKTAKRLRRQALLETIGKPWVKYSAYPTGIRLSVGCGRAMYKALKREANGRGKK